MEDNNRIEDEFSKTLNFPKENFKKLTPKRKNILPVERDIVEEYVSKSNEKTYSENQYNTLLVIIFILIVALGSFFVWSVLNDKFKSDLTCPQVKCTEVTCPEVNLDYPDCICDQDLNCPDNTQVVNAINNMSLIIKKLNISS